MIDSEAYWFMRTQLQITLINIYFTYSTFEPGTLLEEPQYNSYGVTCTEVELDVLTGQYLINRVDMLFDCGERYLISNSETAVTAC